MVKKHEVTEFVNITINFFHHITLEQIGHSHTTDWCDGFYSVSLSQLFSNMRIIREKMH
jgi:hypothetical protein